MPRKSAQRAAALLVALTLLVTTLVRSTGALNTFAVTGFQPVNGSVNGGTLVSFTGTLNGTISNGLPLSVLLGALYCDVQDNYLETITDFVNPQPLFTCVTRPVYNRVDQFPAAALTPVSAWNQTVNVTAVFNGANTTCTQSAGACNYTYSRALTPILTGVRYTNQDMSVETGVIGPWHLPISSSYLTNPVTVNVSGNFLCNDISCLKNVYFNNPSLECLLRDPSTDVPYGFSPGNAAANVPASAICVFYTMIPGSFMPLVYAYPYGYSMLLDSSQYITDQYGNLSTVSFTPVINELVPPTLSLRGGDTLTINGAGFSLDVLYPFNASAYAVTVGKVPCVVTLANDTQIQCILQSGWEAQEQPLANNGTVAGLSVKWYTALNLTITQVLNPAANPKYPNSPDRWYVMPTLEAPVTQNDIITKKAWINQWDYYGRVICGYFLPPVSGTYYFSALCTGTCNVYLTDPDTGNASLLVWDNSDPNLAFSFWKPNQASSGPVAMLSNKTYRFEFQHVAADAFDFVAMQVRYPNGSAYAIPTSLWSACYFSSLQLPIVQRQQYYGGRGVQSSSLGVGFTKGQGGNGALYAALQSGATPQATYYQGMLQSLLPASSLDYETLLYYTPFRSGDYAFTISMNIQSPALAPESELYLYIDDQYGGQSNRQVLLAHSFVRSYLGAVQTSPTVHLLGGHRYLLQYYLSQSTYPVNISVSELSANPAVVYNPIPTDSLISSVDYPAVSLSLYGIQAVCNVSYYGKPCRFLFAPVVHSLSMPGVLVGGSIVNMTLDTWSITNILGNETLYIDSAVCPITSVNYSTGAVGCTVAYGRYGGIIDLGNLTLSSYGVGDTRDISNVYSIAPFNVSSASVFQYMLTGQIYNPLRIRIVLGGIGFDNSGGPGTGHNMVATLSDGVSAPTACAVEGVLYDSLTVNCIAPTLVDSYSVTVALTHSGVTISNTSVVSANSTAVLAQLMAQYPYQIASAATSNLSVYANPGAAYGTVQSTVAVTGGTFSDRLTSTVWWNTGAVVFSDGSGMGPCNVTSVALSAVTLQCLQPLSKLNVNRVQLSTTVNGSSAITYATTAAQTYNYTAVDVLHLGLYPPTVTGVVWAGYDFTGSSSYASFSVMVYINGTWFGQAGPTPDFSQIPTYMPRVTVYRQTAPASGNVSAVWTIAGPACNINQTMDTVLLCRQSLSNVGNDTFMFQVEYVSNGTSLLNPALNATFVASTVVLQQQYSEWLLSQQQATSSPNLVAIVVPSVLGSVAILGLVGATVYAKHAKTQKLRRQQRIAAEEELAAAEALAALERDEMGGLTQRKNAGPVFVNF